MSKPLKDLKPVVEKSSAQNPKTVRERIILRGFGAGSGSGERKSPGVTSDAKRALGVKRR